MEPDPAIAGSGQDGLPQPDPAAVAAAAIEERVLARLNQQVGAQLASLALQVEEAARNPSANPVPAPASSSSAKVSPAKPEKYSGQTGKADQWTFEMEQYFKACGIQDPHRVPFAGAMLTGNASIWWRSVANDTESPITTWDQFKSELIFNFKHYDNTKAARNRLRSLQQRTSVSQFYAEFVRATLEIPGITEDEKMDRFLAGLKPNLQREIVLREPEDFNTMVKLAHKLDALFYTASGNRSQPTFFARQFDRSSSSAGRPQTSHHSSRPVPMELGAIQHNGAGPSNYYRPKLSDTDKSRLRTQGRCFYCKEPGHIAEYCPKKPGNERKAGKAPAR